MTIYTQRWLFFKQVQLILQLNHFTGGYNSSWFRFQEHLIYGSKASIISLKIIAIVSLPLHSSSFMIHVLNPRLDQHPSSQHKSMREVILVSAWDLHTELRSIQRFVLNISWLYYLQATASSNKSNALFVACKAEICKKLINEFLCGFNHHCCPAEYVGQYHV